ncbi:MAG: dihydropteroate synthase [Acidimicrobiales bacterium]|nr:dihydropteroate synthase [Acidimicrobiales bacterium]
MGILNVTPDSFSDGGQFANVPAAVAQAERMAEEGADIIDVGGESTRPGAAPVSIDQEIARVVPVIRAITGIARISVDTRNGAVAEAAVGAGATLINDVSATLGPIAAKLGVGYIAMHMQGEPGSMQEAPRYHNVVTEVCDFLSNRAEAAAAAGCGEVWIDPGFGFGKTEEHNLDLLTQLNRITALPYPVMVGISRKRWIGALHTRSDRRIQSQAPEVGVDDRLEGSVATAAYAMLLGAKMIRVHDVKAGWQAAVVASGQISPDEMYEKHQTVGGDR